MTAFFDEVGISPQRKGVLLPSFIIFLVLTKPVNDAIFQKIASLFFQFQLFNYLSNYFFYTWLG